MRTQFTARYRLLSPYVWRHPTVFSEILIAIAVLNSLNPGQADEPAAIAAVDVGQEHAVWIAHDYMKSAELVAQVPQMADAMKNQYHVRYLFVNVGRVDPTGKLVERLPQAAAFLNTLQTWEATNNYRFHVQAMLNASLTPGDKVHLDLSDPTVFGNILEESRRLVSTTDLGSYTPGAARAFDGIQADFEPAGQDPIRFARLTALMDAIRVTVKNVAPDKTTSFCAPKHGPTSVWNWDSQWFYEMGRRVDMLPVMTYDTGLTTGAEYRVWMRRQTVNTLRAVSGSEWNNDALHPRPSNSCKVFLGFPAYPAGKWHDKSVETILYAGPGVRDALRDLTAAPALVSFGGAAVYCHKDGRAGTGYADRETDWRWFQENFLREATIPVP